MKRTLIIINKSHRDNRGQLASAIGHVSQSLAIQAASTNTLSMVDYTDADGNVYPGISEYPVIALTGNASKIWTLWDFLVTNDIPRAAYLDSMMTGGSVKQVENTSSLGRADLVPMVTGCFCDADEVAALTKKMSLFK